MPKHTLDRTYLVSGQHLGPGEVDLTDDQVTSLTSVGAIKPGSSTTENVTPGDPVRRAGVRTVTQDFGTIGMQQTADPSSGLPPPVIHTTAGIATEPSEDDDSDDESDDEEDTDEAQTSTPGTSDTLTATEPDTQARPSRRVGSRPRPLTEQ